MNVPAKLRRHILLVDDEPSVCEAVTKLLQYDGHLVESTNNVTDALDLFEPGKFDVVITDGFMPIMSGEQFASAIKAKDPIQPIVLLTAFPERFNSTDRPLKGIDSLLAKPLALEELRKAITGLNLPA